MSKNLTKGEQLITDLLKSYQAQGVGLRHKAMFEAKYKEAIETIDKADRTCKRVYRAFGIMSELRCSECGSQLFYTNIGDYCKCGCRIVESGNGDE